MPKVTRKKLSRGTKLFPEHFQALSDIDTHVATPALEREQMPEGRAAFRLNFHIPYISGEYFGYATEAATGYKRPYGIPFILPPLQDYFDVTAGDPNYFTVDEDTPGIVLEEVHFSFDQRQEPAAITGHGYNSGGTGHPSLPNAEAGLLDFENIGDRYNLSLAIVEKTPSYFTDNTLAAIAEISKEVWSVEIPSDAFSGKHFRLNPYVVTKIGREFHPYKTYMAQIYCDDLYNGNATTVEDFALVSVHLSLKFSHPLVGRDVGTEQNMPTAHNGDQTGNTSITTNLITAGNSIPSGDEGRSVSRLMGEIDDLWKRGMRGGYDRFADALPAQEISDDAGYEAIVIPLMQCRKYGGVTYNNTTGPAWEPYWENSTPRYEFGDRRILPIVESLTIQHVFFAFSKNPFEESVGGSRVSDFPSTSMTGVDFEAGLAMGSGLRGDNVDYTQIAGLTWANFGGAGQNVVDDLDGYLGQTVSTDQWTLMNMPLVGSGGAGFFSQGPPIFVGRGTNNVSARSNVNGSAPPTGGAETFLEARVTWKGVQAGLGAGFDGEILSGWGGHYIIVIAKKFMTYPRSR